MMLEFWTHNEEQLKIMTDNKGDLPTPYLFI